MKSWSSLRKLHGGHCFVLFLLLFVTVTATTGAIPRPEHPEIAGYCYTQLTDVEQEVNGVYTYDRKLKFDTARLKKYFGAPAAIEKSRD
jgi:hypothetical protein